MQPGGLYAPEGVKLMASRLLKGVVRSYDAGTGTAEVEIVGSHSRYITCPVSTDLNAEAVVVGKKCAVLAFDEHDQSDAVLVATYDDVFLMTTPSSHASRHEDGGADEISVADLSGLLADGQTPLAHKTSHQNGGADELSIEGLEGLSGSDQNPVAHRTTHENGGGDEMNVVGMSGLLADGQTPLAHAASHENGGSDEIDVTGLEGAGGGAGAWALIASSVLSGGDGTFSFTSIPSTYNHLVLMGRLRSDRAANDIDSVGIRFNNDSGASQYSHLRVYHTSAGAGSHAVDRSDGEFEAAQTEAATSTAGRWSQNKWTFPLYANTSMTKTGQAESFIFKDESADVDATVFHGIGYWRSTAAINRIDVFPINGTNFKQYSALYLYGVT